MRGLGCIVLKALLRFTFMFVNNCVAIPSYCLYLIVLQPLKMLHSDAFWHIEGIMYRWLLAMVASWGWCAGYTGNRTNCFSYTSALKCIIKGGRVSVRVLESVKRLL